VKIAIVTDDGQSISAHFGRARAYAVITVEDGVVVGREIRPKAAPHLDAAAPMERSMGPTTAVLPTPATIR